jgi:hypothetical protein
LQNLLQPISGYGQERKLIAKLNNNPFLHMGRRKKKSHCKIDYNPFVDSGSAQTPWEKLTTNPFAHWGRSKKTNYKIY